MRIAIFSDTFLPKIDGVGISTYKFTKNLASNGHKILIICPRYKMPDKRIYGENIEIVRLANTALPSYPDVKIIFPQKKKIRKKLKEFQPDLIHIQTPGFIAQYSLSFAKKMKLPLIGTYHTMMTEMTDYITPYRLFLLDRFFRKIKRKKKLKEKKMERRLVKIDARKERPLTQKVIAKLVNRIYEKCDLIITPSEAIRENLKSYDFSNSMEVVSNGIDLENFPLKPRELNIDSPRILHAGRIGVEKNVNIVIKAFKLLLQKMPQARLDIIGEGPALSAIRQMTQQYHLQDQVKTLGFIHHEELIGMYSNYDLFMTASTIETQGLVVLESQACGVPSLGVKAYALPELIRHGHNGYLVEPFHHEAMAHYAYLMLSHPKRYRQMSVHAVSMAKQHDIHASVEKLENIYQKLIEIRSIKKG